MVAAGCVLSAFQEGTEQSALCQQVRKQVLVMVPLYSGTRSLEAATVFHGTVPSAPSCF